MFSYHTLSRYTYIILSTDYDDGVCDGAFVELVKEWEEYKKTDPQYATQTTTTTASQATTTKAKATAKTKTKTKATISASTSKRKRSNSVDSTEY